MEAIMWRSMIKVASATAVFALLHSALASRGAKRTAAQVFGERNRNGLYRVFYLAQSVLTFGMLVAYARRLPSRELYQIRGPLAWLLHTGQVGAILAATAAAREVGIRRILGLESLRGWLDDGPVPPEPEAQGPALDAEGRLHVSGPFAWSRHPLNLVPLPVFWLCPRMTTSLLAFNTAATIYLILGSLHEEARLREAYGEAYAEYQRSGISFYLPTPNASSFEPQMSPPCRRG
jgi:hypothetical protein